MSFHSCVPRDHQSSFAGVGAAVALLLAALDPLPLDPPLHAASAAPPAPSARLNNTLRRVVLAIPSAPSFSSVLFSTHQLCAAPPRATPLPHPLPLSSR